MPLKMSELQKSFQISLYFFEVSEPPERVEFTDTLHMYTFMKGTCKNFYHSLPRYFTYHLLITDEIEIFALKKLKGSRSIFGSVV